MEREQGNIIFLNGASSSGKSTIAKLLQERLVAPFLHMPLDSFIDMLPHVDDESVLRLAPGFHRAIAAMAEVGNNVIVDHVLVADGHWLRECVRLLTGPVVFVGLHCTLPELERRERDRDAKRQGFARAQFDIVHVGKTYDIELDTLVHTSSECADEIVAFFTEQEPTAFARMRRSLGPDSYVDT